MEVNAEPLVMMNSFLGDERRMQEETNCEETSSLATTFVSDTQAYGVMFTVRGKDEPLLIATLELSSIFLEDEREIHVAVYTKEGSYQNFENNPSAWIKIADTNLAPSKEGSGTLIPARQFNPVQVDPYSVRAFYVTLDTTDLRYSTAPGRPVGSVYVQDEFIEIQLGAGLLEFPFSDRIFEPRVFCGIVHYKRIVECDSAAIATTKVSYAFLVQHDNMSDNIVISQVNTIARASIVALMSSEPELASYMQSASLALDSVDTTISTAFNPEAYAECISNTVRKCTALVTEVRFKHTDALSKGDLIYRMLCCRLQVTSNLNLGDSMDVTYVGRIPLETAMLVRLDSTPSDQTMNTKQTSYFESTTQMFLEDKLSKIPAITILGVRVNEQQRVGGIRVSVAERQLEDEDSLSAFDVSTIVTAALRPPPFVDFGTLIEGAIDLNTDEYRNDLVNRKDLQLDMADGRFFEQIQHIQARPANGTDRYDNASKSEESSGALSGWAIMLIVLLSLILSAGGVYFIWKRCFVKQQGKEKQARRSSAETEHVDDHMSEIYENAFRGFDGNDYALFANATGSTNNKRKSPQAWSNKKASSRRTMPQTSVTVAGRGMSISGNSRSVRSSSRSTEVDSSGYSSRGLSESGDSRSFRSSSRSMGAASSGYSSRGLSESGNSGSFRSSSRSMGAASSGYSSRGLAESGHSGSFRSSSRSMGAASYDQSSRGMEPTPRLTGNMDNEFESSRRQMARASSDRGSGGDDINSVDMEAVSDYVRNPSAPGSGERWGPPDSSGTNRSNRSARIVLEDNARPAVGDTVRARSTRGTTGRNADDTISVGMRATMPNPIDPVNREHDEETGMMDDMSVVTDASSQRAIQSSSHHTLKRNNRADSKASNIGDSSQHTVKRNNTSDRNLGTKQWSGIDEEMVQSYVEDPEDILETGGRRG